MMEDDGDEILRPAEREAPQSGYRRQVRCANCGDRRAMTLVRGKLISEHDCEACGNATLRLAERG